ncbi:MAG: hypothetical protein H7343_16855 [Undibacterium sp.]|nr:hypothetical protein [Opitutaceae bacterium]
MCVNQLFAAAQFGKVARFARLEFYTKDYTDLVTLNRTYRPIAGGTGPRRRFRSAREIAAPVGGERPPYLQHSDTRRTDPDSGRMARSCSTPPCARAASKSSCGTTGPAPIQAPSRVRRACA